jgi:hypothetical protein
MTTQDMQDRATAAWVRGYAMLIMARQDGEPTSQWAWVGAYRGRVRADPVDDVVRVTVVTSTGEC